MFFVDRALNAKRSGARVVLISPDTGNLGILAPLHLSQYKQHSRIGGLAGQNDVGRKTRSEKLDRPQ